MRYEHKDDRLRVTLDPPPKAGERRSFTVTYHGKPAAGLRIGKNRHGERTFFSENWPDKAREWLPIIDHPHDKATSEFIVTAPARYQVVANGLLEEETRPRRRPASHPLEGIGADRLVAERARASLSSPPITPVSVNGVPLEAWVFHQDRDAVVPALEEPVAASSSFTANTSARSLMRSWPAFRPPGSAAESNIASAIFYGERSVLGRGVTSLVAHEIAHQWFGDSVTERDWDDVWLSEGFATYFTLLFTEHDEGRDAFVTGLKRSRRRVFTIEKRNPGLAVLHDNLSDMKRVLNRLVYQKGGWTLHMLRARGWHRHLLGRHPELLRALSRQQRLDRRLQARHGGNLRARTWPDSSPSGSSGAGSPELQGHWQYNEKDKRIEIDLDQIQAGDPYRLPMEIGISTAGVTPAADRKGRAERAKTAS